jgi:hypothetical protein
MRTYVNSRRKCNEFIRLLLLELDKSKTKSIFSKPWFILIIKKNTGHFLLLTPLPSTI